MAKNGTHNSTSSFKFLSILKYPILCFSYQGFYIQNNDDGCNDNEDKHDQYDKNNNGVINKNCLSLNSWCSNLNILTR